MSVIVVLCGLAVSVRAETPPAAIDRESLRKTVAALSAPEMEGRAPLSQGSLLARDYIIARMASYGLVPGGDGPRYEQVVRKKLFGYTIGYNLVGFIAGKVKPEECVYVDAHYDHWGKAGGQIQPGANDNASGVALMLELARIVSQSQLDRTVVFLASDYEEGALLPMGGAIKGADFHVREALCARENIRGALVLDTVGGPFVPGLMPRLFLIGGESSRELYDLSRSLALNNDSDVPISSLGVYAIEPLGSLVPRADYGAFRRIKAPFILATSGLSPDYHLPSDTMEKIDFDFMTRAGSELLKIVLKLASSDFSTAPFQRGEVLLDWTAELAAVERLMDEILSSGRPPPGKAHHLERLRAQREQLRAKTKPDSAHLARKRRIQKIVITILKLNGTLKLKERLYRTHI